MLCIRIDVTQDVFAVAVRIGATPFNGLPERDDQGPGSPFKREYRAVLDRRSIWSLLHAVQNVLLWRRRSRPEWVP